MALLEQARRDVLALYSLQDRVLLVNNTVLFCKSLEDHLAQPLGDLQNWLVINKALILQSVRNAFCINTHPIQRFFTRQVVSGH